MKKLIFYILILFLGLTANELYSAPASIDSLIIYKDTFFSDSSIFYISVGDVFYLRADTNFPSPPQNPADYLNITCTHTSNPNDTVYIKLSQDSSDTNFYKSEAVNIVSEGLSNSQLKNIGVKANSGETIWFSYKGTIFDSLVVAISKEPLAINNLNFMTSNYNEVLTGNIIQNSIMYVESNGVDGNEVTIDTLACVCTSTEDPAGIRITLTETGKNTGEYHNSFILSTFSNQTLGYLEASDSGTVIYIQVAKSNYTDTHYDSVTISLATLPSSISSVDFKVSGYSSLLTGEVLPDDVLYIELVGIDGNPNTADTTNIVAGDGVSETITVTLIESNSNSGIYRGSITLSSVTNQTEGTLKVSYGSTVKVLSAQDSSDSDIVTVTIPSAPSGINNLRFMNSDYTSALSEYTSAGNILYIEANGTDGNSLISDTLTCYVFSTYTSETNAITVTLTETNKNTGKYRGIVTLNNYTDNTFDYIKAYNAGETILIRVSSSSYSDTKYDTVIIRLPSTPVEFISLEFKNSSYNSSLTGEVLPSDILYFEALAVDSNSNTIDTLAVKLWNTVISETITISLVETSINSGKFRGSASLGSETNKTTKVLRANYGDTVKLEISDSAAFYDSVLVTRPLPPTEVQSIKFKNSTYSSDLGDSTDAYVKLYIELIATDRNPYSADTVNVNCTGTYDTISVVLTEIGKSQGVYRGYVELNNFTYQSQNYLKAYLTGETVIVSLYDKQDMIYVMTSAQPVNIISINSKTSASYLINKTSEYTVDDIIYIEVIADDVNPLTVDSLDMEAYSSSDVSDRVNFSLTETTENSGRYRGYFKITTLSNDTIDELNAEYGDTIYVLVKNSTDPSDTIQLKMTTPLSPVSYNELKFKQSNYTSNWLSYEQVTFGNNIYISLTATDRNELTIDTAGVIIFTIDNNGDTNFNDSRDYLFNLSLEETGKHTGIFQGSLRLDENQSLSYANQIKTKIGAQLVLYFGDTPAADITQDEFDLILGNTVDTVYTAVYDPPDDFISLKLKNQTYSATNLEPIKWGEYIYIEVTADKTTSSNLLADTVKITIESTTEVGDDPDTTYELTESDIHSGIYRTSVYIIDFLEAGVLLGERVEVNSKDWVQIKVLNPDGTISSDIPTFFRQVAYNISPTRLKRPIRFYRDSNYSNVITNSKISFEDEYKYIYIEAEAYDIVAITDTYAYANDKLKDTVSIKLNAASGNDSITVELLETSVNSNIYRNYLVNPYVKDFVTVKIEGRSELEAARPDTIYIWGDETDITDSAFTQLYVEDYRQPADSYVTGISFYENASYSQILSRDLLKEDFVYVELRARENASAAILRDTKEVTIHRNLNTTTGVSQDSITVILTETAVGSELYHILGNEPVPKIYWFTADDNNYIKGEPGDTMYATLKDDTAVKASFTIGSPQLPSFIHILSAFLTSEHIDPVDNNGFIPNDAVLYLEAIGDAGNEAIVDTAPVRITNITEGSDEYIDLVLTESGVNSGKYYDNFSLKSYTNNTLKELGVNYGDSIKIVLNNNTIDTTRMSAADYPKYYRISFPLSPGTVRNVRFMNSTYSSKLTGFITPRTTLFVEANGTDASEFTADTLTCYCTSTDDPAGMSFDLVETGYNTGKYTGSFKLHAFSSSILKYLQAENPGAIVQIRVVNSNGGDTKTDTVVIQNSTPPNNVLNITFMESDYSSAIYGNVLPDDILYIQATGEDENVNTSDTMLIRLVNTTASESITLSITETEKNSSTFQGSITLGNETNQTQDILKASYGDTIIVMSVTNQVVQDTVIVASPQPPAEFQSLKFKNSSYSTDLGDSTDAYVKLYVELTGTDKSIYLIDTVSVSCRSTYDTLLLILEETEKNSGIFRNFIELNNFTYGRYNYLKAYNTGDTVVINKGNFWDTITVMTAAQPSNIISINVKTGNDYKTNKTSEYTFDDIVYVEVIAEDFNPNTVDGLAMQAYASSDIKDRINFTLTETEPGSGKFRGYFNIKTLSNDTIDNLNAEYGDTIYILVKDSVDPADTIHIKMTVPVSPTTYNELKFKESNFTDNWPYYKQVTFNNNLFITLTATDRNALTVDTCGVILYTVSNSGDTNYNDSNEFLFRTTLEETDRNSGTYRGSLTIVEDEAVPLENKIKSKLVSGIILYFGDTPVAKITKSDLNTIIGNSADTIHTAVYDPPDMFISVGLKNSNYSAANLEPLKWNEYLYLEVVAGKTSSSSQLADTVKVTIQSTTEKNGDDPDTIYELQETDIYSGIYRRAVYILSVIESPTLLAEKVEVKSGDWVEIRVLKPDGTLTSDVDPVIRQVAYNISPTRLNPPIVVYRDSSYNERVTNSKLSFEDAYKYMYLEVEAYDIEAITDTYPYANDKLQDTVSIAIKSESTGDSIHVVLLETGVKTNIYRNYLTNPYIKEIVLNKTGVRSELQAVKGDTIVIWGDKSDTTDSGLIELYVEDYKQPPDSYVVGISFYEDNQYENYLDKDLLRDESFYIQLKAYENASAATLIDTKEVWLWVNLSSDIGTKYDTVLNVYYDDTISLILTETEVNSEDYRISDIEPVPKVYWLTDDGNNYITGDPGDVISVTLKNDTKVKDSFSVGRPQPPSTIFALNIFTSPNYDDIPVSQLGFVAENAVLYIEARGDYGNNAIADTTLVKITNITKGTEYALTLTLTESKVNSGRYYGDLSLKPSTNITLKELGVNPGDSITIVIDDAAVNTSSISQYPRIIRVAENKYPTTLLNIKFMDSDYNSELKGDIIQNITLYIEANGNDGSELTVDTLACYCTSTEDPSGIIVTLTETGLHTGKYRGTFSLRSFSDTNLKYLKAEGAGVVIQVKAFNYNGEDTRTDSVRIKLSTAPTSIANIDFKITDYKQSLTDEVLPTQTLFIEAIGADGNERTADTILVYLGDGLSETITITLVETALNSGVFRGTAELSGATNQSAGILKAEYGDYITVQTAIDPSKTDKVRVTTPAEPEYINNLRFMKTGYVSESEDTVPPYAVLYIEANGNDGNNLTVDNLSCTVVSNYTAGSDTIITELVETGNNTGKYRGQITIKDFSSKDLKYIKAGEGSTIKISIIKGNSIKEDTVFVRKTPTTLFLYDLQYSDETTKTCNSRTINFYGYVGNSDLNDTLYVYNSETGETSLVGVFGDMIEFSKEIIFSSDGDKTIIFTAATGDITYKNNYKKITMRIDSTPPLLKIMKPFSGKFVNSKTVTITGKVDHYFKPDTVIVTVNNNSLFDVVFDKSDSQWFNCTAAITGKSAGDMIIVIATDYAGNRIADTLVVYYKGDTANIEDIIVDLPSPVLEIYPDTTYNITFGKDTAPASAKIVMNDTDNIKINLGVSFSDTSAPVSVIIKTYGDSDVKEKLDKADISSLGNPEEYEAGLKTVREINFIKGGQGYNDNSKFKEATISYDLPVTLKGKFVKVYNFNETSSEWVALDESDVVSRTDDVVTYSLHHFSIYGVFVAQTPVSINLNEVVICPNPYIPNDGNPQTGSDADNIFIHITNLTGNNEIQIFDLTGQKIYETRTDMFQRTVVWNGLTSDGEKTASGLYMVVINGGSGNIVKKLTIIR